MAFPALDVIIVNWNAGGQLYDCVKSLASSARDGFCLQNVVIVDNASTDGSADNLDVSGLPIKTIHNMVNLGFGAATNQGARASEATYLLFLNPDTRVHSDTLASAVRFMELPESGQIGIATVQLIDAEGNPNRCCSRFPTLALFVAKILALNVVLPRYFPDQFYLEWDHKSSREVEQVQGAFLLIRRSLFDSLGGFDERFFLYLEDVDLGLRAMQSGWKSYHFAGASAYHKGGGTSERIRTRRLFYSLQSRILYGAKHFRRLSALTLFLLTTLIEPISRFVLAMLRLSASDAVHTFQAYAMLYKALPGLLRIAMKMEHGTPLTAAQTRSGAN